MDEQHESWHFLMEGGMKGMHVEGPVVSVLVAVYNMEAYLARCMTSILGQTFEDFEVILVDDGSTDASGEMCDVYACRDARVRVIHQPNGGLSAARNVGMAVAQGKYFAPVDADDWIEPAYLHTLLRLCEDYGVKLAACNHFIDSEGRTILRFGAHDTERVLSAREALHGVLYHREPDVCVWSKLYHRELLEGLRYPEGRLYEDTWLFAHVMLRAEQVAWTPTALYHYLMRDNSISRSTYTPSKMDYLTAVQHLIEVTLSRYPQESKGCLRRYVHARLSVRRYFVNCDQELRAQRRRLDSEVCRHVKDILCDEEAPRRDKLAVLLTLCGPTVYDIAWSIYERCRRDR